MTEKLRVTMDSQIEKALYIHLINNIVKFKQSKHNLNSMDLGDPKSYITKEKNQRLNDHMMNMVEDNLKKIQKSIAKR